MAIITHCPGCSKRYELDEKLAGKRARCKECTLEFRIPAAEIPVLKAAPRPTTMVEDDELPPPRRATARPVRKRRKINGQLPVLVSVGLTIVGVLMAVPALGIMGLGAARGNSEMILVGGACLFTLVCLGLAAVNGLKLVFITAEEIAEEGLPSVYAPVYAPLIAVRRWDQTSGYSLGWLAGIGGLIVLAVVLPSQMKEVKHPRPGRSSRLRLIVNDVPSSQAFRIVCEKMKPLLQSNGVTSFQARHSGNTAEFDLSPVSDVRALAAGITFGTVTSSGGGEVTVAAAPITADEIAANSAPPVQGFDLPNHKPDPPPAAGDQADVNPFRRKPAPAVAETDENPFRRKAAATAPDTGPLAGLLNNLKSADQGKQRQALEQLSRMDPVDARRDEVQDVLRPLLVGADGFFIREVIKAMGMWHTEETVPALITLTTDRRHDVRWQAIETLGTLDDPRAAEPIASRLKQDGIAAEPALRKLGPAAEPALIELLKSPDRDLRRRACDLLSEIGGKETLAFMSKARPDPDLGVRGAAQRAMQAIAERVGAGR